MKPSTAARREPVTNGSVVCDHQVAAPVEEAASDVPRILTPTHKKTERLRRFRDAGFTSFPFFWFSFFLSLFRIARATDTAAAGPRRTERFSSISVSLHLRRVARRVSLTAAPSETREITSRKKREGDQNQVIEKIKRRNETFLYREMLRCTFPWLLADVSISWRAWLQKIQQRWIESPPNYRLLQHSQTQSERKVIDFCLIQ